MSSKKKLFITEYLIHVQICIEDPEFFIMISPNNEVHITYRKMRDNGTYPLIILNEGYAMITKMG